MSQETRVRVILVGLIIVVAVVYLSFSDLFKVTVTGYKLQLHFEKCNRLQLHEVTFRKNVTGYSYMKLLFKKM